MSGSTYNTFSNPEVLPRLGRMQVYVYYPVTLILPVRRPDGSLKPDVVIRYVERIRYVYARV